MITLDGIYKSFGSVSALSGVSLTVAAGTIHAVAGENGAGKSTLTKIIAGEYQADRGTLRLDGERVRWPSPRHAQAAGIHLIHQELALFGNLSVAENIFIGRERRGALRHVSHTRTESDAAALLRRLGIDLDPRARVDTLSVAEQQMVEIAKALVRDARLIILDEPTSVISGPEVALLFTQVRELRRKGVAIVYISHRIDELFEIADQVTVLKDGLTSGTAPIGQLTRDRLIAMMVGRPLGDLFPPKRSTIPSGPPALRADKITVPGRVSDATLEVRSGEIVALAGLVGAGRSELALALFGAIPAASGTVAIDGAPYEHRSPSRSIALGIGLLTEDRKTQGLALPLDVAANVTASRLHSVTHRGFINRSEEIAAAREVIRDFQVACPRPNAPVETLSGGNQQKVLLGRWASTCSKVLILDEPTRGVDIGAKQEIYRIIRRLADSGLAVLMISSELPEVIGMADRVVVMRQGAVAGELIGSSISEEAIMGLAAHRSAADAEESLHAAH